MFVTIFHHNDLDGRCAAALVYRFHMDAGVRDFQFIELDYKDRVPVERVPDNSTVYIVDFSFKPEVMEALLKLTSDVVWCDHHVTAKDYPYQHLPGKRDFTVKGLSGCELVYLHLYPFAPVPDAVRFIGDYDSWRLRYDPLCFQFYEGAKMVLTSVDSPEWDNVLSDNNRAAEIMEMGKIAIQYRDAYCADVAASFGYDTAIRGHRAFALNTCRFGSKAFGDRFKQYPVCIMYVHNGCTFTVSLYSDTVDVSEIARFYGGGGHKGAAGFVCQTLPFVRHEYRGVVS